MNNLRTVSDTKRDFYNRHTRPINAIYRRVVEELMVEMHLLSVNEGFSHDPIYALGVVTSFNRFMQGYRPERDKDSIFDALCHAVGGEPQKYQQDAERLEALAKRLSKDLVSYFSSPTPLDGANDLQESLSAIALNPKFKYSRLFAIGIFTMLELASPDLIKEEKERNQALKQICDALHLPEEKLQKDLDLYRNNLEKMTQIQLVMEDTLKAERKKREQRTQDKTVVVAPPQTPGT
ncbi:MAG: photosystem II biogenesis protein Psp29 [Chamaesiphon sp.]